MGAGPLLDLRPMRTSPAWILLATVLAACGRGDAGEASPRREARAPDLASPEAVLAQAHRALAAGDWGALRPFLTAQGRARVEADLKAWHRVLTDPATGPRAAARIPVPPDDAGKAFVRRAMAQGDVDALLWVLALADPRVALPAPSVTPRSPDADRVEMDYPARGGERRRVVLSRGPDGWRIDRLQL